MSFACSSCCARIHSRNTRVVAPVLFPKTVLPTRWGAPAPAFRKNEIAREMTGRLGPGRAGAAGYRQVLASAVPIIEAQGDRFWATGSAAATPPST